MKKELICLIFFVLSVFFVNGIYGLTYSVKQDGTGNFTTIQSCANSAQAGDICLVYSGVYNENITVPRSGSSGNEITFAVKEGHEAVVGSWTLNNRNYVRIMGFNINSRALGCILLSGPNTFIEILENNIKNCYYNGIRMGGGGNGSCSNCLIIGNQFEDIGIPTGSGVAITLIGDNSLVAYNWMSNIDPDNLVIFGENVIVRNNYGEKPYYDTIAHADFIQHGSSPLGLKRCTFEYNFYDASGGVANGHSHATQISNGQNNYNNPPYENIFRGNIFHDVGSGDIGINQCFYGCSYFRIYHNTFANSNAHSLASNTRYGTTIYGAGVTNTFLHNNIHYKTWGENVRDNIYVYYVEGGFSSNYNLAYEPEGPITFATLMFGSESNNQRNINPGFIDYANDDFSISNSGGAYNNAGPLTRTVGSGTGNRFSVSDAGFFRGNNPLISQYGGNLIRGDLITIGTDVLRIVSIDYSTNAITVNQSFSWNNEEPVFFGADFTPDIGAYPYKAGGYNIVNNLNYNNGDSISRGNVAIISEVDNSELVRFVEFWIDGILVAIDSDAPYIYNWDTSNLILGDEYIIKTIARPFYANKILSYEDSASIFVQNEILIRSSGSPYGNLSAGTTSTTISLNTNEVAICRYSTTAGVSYNSMANTFSITGSTSHSQLITELIDGNSYSYYVRCRDNSGNANTNDYLISFNISPFPEIVTLQDMLSAYQNYKKSEVNLLYFLDKLRRWLVFW